MKTHGRLVALGTFVLLTVACQSRQPEPEDKGGNWAGRMQGLATEVRDLIPFVYSRQAFTDPANADKIKSGLKKFIAQAHNITPEMGKSYFGHDPLVSYSLESMQDDLKRANEAFTMGQVEYARSVAKAATNHCFRCHSITKEGNQAAWDVTQFSTLQLTPLERVDLIIATRRYAEATQYLEGLLHDQQYVQNFPFDFEAALRKYLSLMIRAENNPERPLRELDRVLAMKGVPFYVAEQARAWRNSLLEWDRTKAKKSKKDLLAQARDHIRRATQIQQYAKDHAGDIEYLRATALLHEFLRQSQATVNGNAKAVADAYFLLGQAYEVLDELGYWNLHEIYYESCIKQQPHSELAKKCFSRLEASIYLGFSGSSGVHIPANERDRLKRLRELTL